MLGRVNVPPALVMALEVQAARGNNSECTLQGCESNRGRRDSGEARTFAALQALFVLRRNTVTIGRNRHTQPGCVHRKLKNIGVTLTRNRVRGSLGYGSKAKPRTGRRGRQKLTAHSFGGLCILLNKEIFGRFYNSPRHGNGFIQISLPVRLIFL